MSDSPQLSLIIAVYNGEKFLSTFFDSIKNQHLSHVELIVVNDGSTDGSADIIERYAQQFSDFTVLNQENGGVSAARNTGLAVARGQYVAFPDIDDVIYPGMYNRLLEIALQNDLDVATCNGTYIYDDGRPAKKIFPSDRLSSTGVLEGPVWLEMALRSRKFLHVTWLNIYRHDFIKQHGFRFEPGLRHQDIPWTTELLLTAKRVQYVDEALYDYLIHSASVSHTPGTDDTRMRSSRHYMKILEMLNDINRRYPEQVKRVPSCHWQIAKEGLGILHSINNIEDPAKKREITQELFDRGIWSMIWKNARGFKLRWRLGRRYFRLKKIIS
ncbi:glycosyltransferase [Atlantibacter subterraneus]|jgi:heptose III glucuronosyltransferase|uniref:glycosyltransferase n=1 Tax=Atlantibacter subterraneus TaxID=255519 RepID=UPI001183095F|nr:glycosyltransferase [Atlantibacter subterranea]MDW2744461.1 glycosyltransferase [Atlantibacter subterranea]QFH69281.1 glycosyltransferase [Enterobacter sp. E76]TSJ50277.1 glycosyltransferase [Atlantibacter subterranea]UTJ47390.1 glycosyltransferase [Atlantibacter subterranea]